MTNEGNHSQEPNLGAVFDQHIKHEFQDHDVDATMETMTKEPYVHHVPMMTGGIGYAGVYNFYKNHFIGKMPDDTKVVRISRTVDKDQVVDELVLSFTHDREIYRFIRFYRIFPINFINNFPPHKQKCLELTADIVMDTTFMFWLC